MRTDKAGEPAAILYNLWRQKYGLKKPYSITRQAFHLWLGSKDKVPPISAHRVFALGDMLNVSPRWLLYGEHMGTVSMESYKSWSKVEARLVESFRQLDERGQARLVDRATDLLELHTVPRKAQTPQKQD